MKTAVHRKAQTLLVLFVSISFAATGVLTASCGGGGGSGSKGGGTSNNGSLAVSVALPTGYESPNGGLRLSGGQFDPVAVTSGAVRVKSWPNDRQLVAAIDGNDNPVLLGFVSPGHQVLNTQTTAVALTYLAMDGFAAPYESQESILEILENDPMVLSIGDTIGSDLKSAGNLSSPSLAYNTAIRTEANLLLGQVNSSAASGGKASKKSRSSSSLNPSSVAVNPFGAPKSGVSMLYADTPNTLYAANTFRRRVLLFVDQVSVTDTNGVVTPNPQTIGNYEVAPAQGQVSPYDLLSALGFDSKTTVSENILLPDLSSNLKSAQYQVVAAGGGSNFGSNPTLTISEQAQLQAFFARSFVKDYFLPVFNVMMGNAATSNHLNGNVRLYQVLESAVDSQSDAVQTFVTANYPSATPFVQSGDYNAALNAVLNSTSAKGSASQFAKFYLGLAQSAGVVPGSTTAARYETIIDWISKLLIGRNTGALVLPQMSAVSASNQFDTWEADVTNAQVSVLPPSPTVSNTVAAQLTAPIQAKVSYPGGIPAGSSLVYTWTTSGQHGDLTIDGKSGTSFTNVTNNTAVYGATTGLTASAGTDTVDVEVSLQDSKGGLSKIGHAQSTVTINGDYAIKILPSAVSVKPGETSRTFQAVTNSSPGDPLSPGTKVRWSVSPANLGTISAGTQSTDQTSATFTAGSTEGSGKITCVTLDAKDNITGSATATVSVSPKTSVTYGGVAHIVHNYTKTDGSRADNWVIYVSFPVPAGAKSVAMNCYNFHDPSYWQYSISSSGTFDGKTWHWQGGDDINGEGLDAGTVDANGQLFFALTGGSGGGDKDESQVTSEQNQRFHNMVVQATFTY